VSSGLETKRIAQRGLRYQVCNNDIHWEIEEAFCETLACQRDVEQCVMAAVFVAIGEVRAGLDATSAGTWALRHSSVAINISAGLS